MSGEYRRGMGRSTHFSAPRADEHSVRLFGRDDDAVDQRASGGQHSPMPSSDNSPVRASGHSPVRASDQVSPDMEDVHGELDDIEGRLTALRARQAVARLRATST